MRNQEIAAPFLRTALFCLASLSTTQMAVAAADRSEQRLHYRNAMNAVERGPADAWKPYVADLGDYPLLPYLELALLERGSAKPSRTQVQEFAKRWPESLVATTLVETTLRELANAGDWPTFRALWNDSQATDLRCAFQRSRIAAGEKPKYSPDIDTLWMQPRPAPSLCEPLFTWARQNGELDDAEVWKRIEAAAIAANPGTVSAIATMLSGNDKAAADRIAASVSDPASALATAAGWTDTPRNRDAISLGMYRFARKNSAAAEVRWNELENKFSWDPAQKNRVNNAIAIYRATNYGDGALARLKALPDGAQDDASREWRVRVALNEQDWNEALAALDAMSEVQLSDARWRYLRARMLSKLDREAEAAPEFAAVATEANFHGFLAADWINAPYSICPSVIEADKGAEAAMAAQTDLARALEFHALGDLPQGRREWKFALTKFDSQQKLLAADLAYRNNWYDPAIFLLSSTDDTLSYYEQRFPLGQKSRVTQSAREAGVDPAWSYAIIRAESAWMSDAHSHADAYGLMQLLPGVAKKVANSAKLPYSKPGDLFEPGLNIQLGTLFLGQMSRQYSGSPWLASAAYNAGGVPVGRWLAARPELEPDFFIETIPYKETRDYVARVLAFSVLYDWRLNGKVIPVATRLPKIGQPYKAPKDDAQRKAVMCADATKPPPNSQELQ